MPEIKDKDKVKSDAIEIKDESEIYALGSTLYKRFTYWRDRKRQIEEQWLKNLRAYHAVYESTISSEFDPNGSKQYIGITRMKTTAAYSRIIDVIFPNTGYKFWGIKPTPFATLDKSIWGKDELVDVESGEKIPDEIVLDETSKRMSSRINDQLIESNADALIRAAIKDATVFGSGVIKAGMVRVVTSKNWVQGPLEWEMVKEDDIVPGLDQPSPFDVYFDINASSVESSIGVYERHILNKSEVRDLKDEAGFRGDVIDELTMDYPNGNHNREHHEIERQALGNITTTADNTGYYEVLEYWGRVDGKQLESAGMEVSEDS